MYVILFASFHSLPDQSLSLPDSLFPILLWPALCCALRSLPSFVHLWLQLPSLCNNPAFLGFFPLSFYILLLVLSALHILLKLLPLLFFLSALSFFSPFSLDYTLTSLLSIFTMMVILFFYILLLIIRV